MINSAQRSHCGAARSARTSAITAPAAFKNLDLLQAGPFFLDTVYDWFFAHDVIIQ